MSTSAFAAIVDQAKVNLIPRNYTEVNAKKRKEIARTFICAVFL